MPVQPVAHWLYAPWSKMARREVWVERLDDGRWQVRWRGGEWTDRDGSRRERTKDGAWVAVRALIGDGEGWTRVDQSQPSTVDQ